MRALLLLLLHPASRSAGRAEGARPRLTPVGPRPGRALETCCADSCPFALDGACDDGPEKAGDHLGGGGVREGRGTGRWWAAGRPPSHSQSGEAQIPKTMSFTLLTKNLHVMMLSLYPHQSFHPKNPELLKTYAKLGIPLDEQKILAGVVAVDAVFDSVSVATTFRGELAKVGVIFCPISEAIRDYPELVKKYIGSVVPVADNYFSALNSAVFTDGSFVYIPKGVRCPMELSTYFRINEANTGQFERTLIIAEDEAYVSYLEGCTAPQRDENQLHAAVVELVAMDDAEIKYSTVQNWYPGKASLRC